jgi:hypothetical protein
MSVTLPPPPPKKKSGLGCLGCGCGALLLIVVLFVGLVGVGCYVAYHKAEALTSTTQTDVPTFSGDASVLTGAQQKIATFQKDEQAHKPSTLQLNSDEINALIAASPDLAKKNIHAFITLTGSDARVQASVPTDNLVNGLFPNRYFNFDTTLALTFDPSTKMIQVMPHTLQLGDQMLMGGTSGNDDANTQATMRAYGPMFNQGINNGLRKNAGGADVLDHAKRIEVKDGEFIIETE